MTLKSDDQSSQKSHAEVCSSTTSLHKNGFGLENIQNKPALNVLPWPQEGMVYIYMKLVTISQLPPQDMVSKRAQYPLKRAKNIQKQLNKSNKNHILKLETHFVNILG
jgi:hypothetical protein